MAGDGVSLSTTLAQMGSVAKTQAKGQQAAQQTTPFADQLQTKDELKVQRVNEAAEAEKNKLDADAEKNDRRKKRRQKRNKKLLDKESEQNQEDLEASEETAENIGSLIDMHA